jgi:signal transduction histidine kinase
MQLPERNQSQFYLTNMQLCTTYGGDIIHCREVGKHWHRRPASPHIAMYGSSRPSAPMARYPAATAVEPEGPMSFSVRLWAMSLVSFSAFTVWLFIHDEVIPGLSAEAYQALIACSLWVLGIGGTLLINRFHRKAERLAEQAARDDTVIQLAGGVAHEMNQPLTIIISTAELLARRDPTRDDLKPYLHQLIQASERLAGIVQKLEGATSYRVKPYVGTLKIVDLDGNGLEERAKL